MPKKDARILNALLSIHPTGRRPAWHGAPTTLGLLRGVTPDVAVCRPFWGANNVREIALHVGFWESNVANRLTGETVRMPFEQRETGWPVRVDAIAAEQWKAEVRLVAQAHERLVQCVGEFDPKLLDRPPGSRGRRIAIELMHGVAEHSLYHAAQIKMLKTLANTLNAGSGL